MEVTDWLLDGDPAIRWQVLRDLIHASTLPTLLLRDLGLDPASPAARETISLVAANCRWEHDGQAFFDGEVEACNNGRTLSIGAYFDADVDGLVTGLLSQRPALRRVQTCLAPKSGGCDDAPTGQSGS